jgi:hypothetical protein
MYRDVIAYQISGPLSASETTENELDLTPNRNSMLMCYPHTLSDSKSQQPITADDYWEYEKRDYSPLCYRNVSYMLSTD